MLLAARAGAVVPAIWRLEIASGLRSAIRRRRMLEAERDEILAALLEMNAVTDPDTDRFAWTTTGRLADRHGLTPHDTSYLDLALRLNLLLGSLEIALRDAAKAESVKVDGA